MPNFGDTSNGDRPIEEDNDRKSFVGPYADISKFPFEIGETVWVVKPGYRAPLGEFLISKAHPNNYFELVWKANRTPHSELVEEIYLARDPFIVGQ